MTSTAEAFEAGFAGGADIFGLAVDAFEAAIGAADVAEFGGEDDFVATVGDGLADEDFVIADAIHVGGVEEIHAEFDAAVDDADGLLIVAVAVKFAHPHAAQADGGDG